MPRRLDAARNAREERVKRTEQTELENARQVIRELREELEMQKKAWAEETRALEQCEKDRVTADEEIARLDALVKELEGRAVPDKEGCNAARVEAADLRAQVAGLELELEAVRSAKNADEELLTGERNEAIRDRKECHRVWQGFINECAALLGLPKKEGCSEYGGGAVRKGIQRLRGALEKINEIRNDVIGRQSVGWSKHIYPLVAALDEAGFKGAPYEKAREKVEATIKAAREMVVKAWAQERTRDTIMDVNLAEEFAEILFPFLEALEFYALLGNWQDMKGGHKESACDRDLGGRARAAMGHPDRDVMEIIGEDDDETP